MSKSMYVMSASAAAVLSAATSTFAATLVAISGTAAPGGGTYSAFTNPVLGNTGQVSFNASIAGGTSTSGIFTGTPGSISAIALQGTAAPAGGNYGSLYTAATTTSLTVNSSGQLAFNAPLTAGTATSGVFTGTSAATLQAVALQGTAAPSGGNFNAFAATGINSAASPVLNNAGQLAFQATLTGGTSTSGEFVGAPGSLQTAALLGGTAPTGGTYATALTAPVLNASGQIAFISLSGSQQGIFSGAPGSIQTVMLQGTAAPGTGGAFYGTPTTTYSFNNAGQVSFISTLVGGTPTSGVFVGAPGAVQPAALLGTLAPGGSGGNYGTFSNAVVSGNGKVAFSSSLTGGTAATGLFYGATGAVQAVALAGGLAPNNGANFSSFGSPLLPNNVGQVAFIGNLTGTGVMAGTNDSALFGGTPDNLKQLVRKGDIIDLDPTDGVDYRWITAISLLINSSGQDGKGISFNDNGVVAYRLTLTDGTTTSFGIFTSTVNAPEPASLSLLAVAGFGLVRRRRAV